MDVGKQVSLLLLAVALPQQQLLHCGQGQAHHDIQLSEIAIEMQIEHTQNIHAAKLLIMQNQHSE